ncbi:MAG: hypothetical protein RL179_384 [Planctomycetota bacterium]|jgi:hypothetical protein
MVTLKKFRDALAGNPGTTMQFMLPDHSFIPPHFHITEVGRVQKDFIDCGGTSRALTTCLLQVLVANDTDHRLNTSKLAGIFNFGNKLFTSDDIPVEVEYEQDAISQFPLADIEITPAGLLFVLGSKHTACLAPDKCGIGVPSTTKTGCTPNTGCC